MVKLGCSCQEQEIVEKIVKRYHGRKGVLVDVLHDVQREFGYLPDSVLRRIARELNYSEAQVFGVASFYSSFYFTPRPANEIKVCTGTACHVRGAPRVLKEFEELLGIAAGETTEDLQIGLETVSCVGCCALAPVVVVNGHVSRQSKPKKILDALHLSREGKNEA